MMIVILISLRLNFHFKKLGVKLIVKIWSVTKYSKNILLVNGSMVIMVERVNVDDESEPKIKC